MVNNFIIFEKYAHLKRLNASIYNTHTLRNSMLNLWKYFLKFSLILKKESILVISRIFRAFYNQNL